MTEAAASVEKETLTVSEGIRIVLRKSFDLPVAKVVEDVQQMVGKAPSKVLVYQIKAKMKNESGIKSSKMKTTKKIVNKNHVHSSKEVSLGKKDSLKVSSTEYTRFAAKLAKVRQYIEEFGSKEELIGWANLA